MLGLIIGLIVVGLIAGAIARLLIPGRQDIGILMTIVLGIVGSFVGGFLGYLLFHKDSAERLHPALGHHRLDHRRGHRAARVHADGQPPHRAPLTSTMHPAPRPGGRVAWVAGVTEPNRTDETIFTWGAPPLKFGAGALDEIGFELSQFDVKRVLIITDPGVNAIGIPQRIQDQLAKYDIASEIFDGVHVEPTDDSIDKAAGYAREQGPWDGFVAVGGGSSIDTAKAVNLLATEGGELIDYINAPIGRASAPRGQLKPLIAVPTTAGTGFGEHRCLRARHLVDAREDRHQSLAAASDAGDHRPAAHDVAAAGGDGVLRHGHRVPRARVVHRALVRDAMRASRPTSASRTAERIRSRTCGARRRCGWPPARSARRCTTAAPTSTRAAT